MRFWTVTGFQGCALPIGLAFLALQHRPRHTAPHPERHQRQRVSHVEEALQQQLVHPLRRYMDRPSGHHPVARSEEHTSELQSQSNLVCRLLLEKKKDIYT